MKSLAYIEANYSVSIEVPLPPNAVFHHLLNDISKFWPEDFEGESTRPGDEFIFTTGDSHYSKNKVAELIPDKKVVWLVTESLRKTDGFDWTGSKMIFELTPKEGNTVLTFTYNGPTLENEYDRLTQICDTVIKEKLYNFLTTGKGK